MKMIALFCAAVLKLGSLEASAQTVSDSVPLPAGAVQGQALRGPTRAQFRRFAAMLATGSGKRKVVIEQVRVPNYVSSGHCGR